jgi:hypothetical protein
MVLFSKVILLKVRKTFFVESYLIGIKSKKKWGDHPI